MPHHNNEPDENHHAPANAVLLGNGELLWFETDAFDAADTRIAASEAKVLKQLFLDKLARQMEIWLEDRDGYEVVIAGPSEHAHGQVLRRNVTRRYPFQSLCSNVQFTIRMGLKLLWPLLFRTRSGSSTKLA